MDEGNTPLSDVLLSLSGGKQYRSNNVTGENGSIVFIGLVSTLKVIGEMYVYLFLEH